VDFAQWLKSYQGCGFVLTVAPKNSKKVLEAFRKEGVEGSIVGKVDATSKLTLSLGEEDLVLFDFKKEIITGCSPSRLPEGRARPKE